MVHHATGVSLIVRAARHLRWSAWLLPLAAVGLVVSMGATATPVSAPPSAAERAVAMGTSVGHSSSASFTSSTSGAQDPPLRWGPPEKVANKRSSEDFDGARIVVRGDQALAVWDRPVKGDPASIQLRASSRGVDGAWTPPRRITRVKAGFFGYYEAALGPGGSAIVVWSYGDDIGHVMEAHREGGSWSTPMRLGGDTAQAPRAVIDGKGDMTVAWTSYPNGSRVDVASRVAGGSWGAVQHLGRFSGDPSIAANLRGDVAVAWGTESGVGVAVRRHGQNWDTAHHLKSVIAYPDDPQVAIGPYGRVVVMWSRSTEEEETFTRRHLAWARTSFDGTWTRVWYLDTRRHVVYGSVPSLSLDGRGHALAVWWTDTGRGADMRASRFHFGQGWSRPRELGGSCCSPVALLTTSRTALALLDRNRRDTATIWGDQQPGKRWEKHALPGQLVTDADGYGNRMAMLYYGPHLTARTLTVPAPSQ